MGISVAHIKVFLVLAIDANMSSTQPPGYNIYPPVLRLNNDVDIGIQNATQ